MYDLDLLYIYIYIYVCVCVCVCLEVINDLIASESQGSAEKCNIFNSLC